MGKKVLITGPTSGTGKYLASTLAAAGYEILLVGRNRDKLESIAESIYPAKSFIYEANFSLPTQVKNVTQDILSAHAELNIIINNAGILGNEDMTVTEDDFEETFAVNYLSHYILVSEVLPLLTKSDRSLLYNMCSQSYAWSSLNFKDLQSKNDYKPMKAYARSKLMLLMLGQWVAENLSSIQVYNIDPGTFRSGISRSRGLAFRTMYSMAKRFMRTPEAACSDIIKTLQSDEVEYDSGVFLRNSKIINTEIDQNDYAQLIEQSINLSASDIRRLIY